MAQTAPQPESLKELQTSAVNHAVAEQAPSLLNGKPALPELDASKLQYTLTDSPRPIPPMDDPDRLSMNSTTDHMITVQWTQKGGWEAPQLKPYGPLSLMPTASVLHYATECFEGMRAYRGFDGKLRIFRSDRNASRMLTSCLRITLPAFPPQEFEKLIMALMAVDGEKWLPTPGHGLYIRPTMIGNSAGIGVQRPTAALLYIFLMNVINPDVQFPGNPWAGPSAQLKLIASAEDSIRAWPGGFGYAKLGANYGPSLLAQGEAKERGFDQVLWLLGKDNLVTEAGASNFFVVWKNKSGQTELITAPLDDRVILDGITRSSVLSLVKERAPELQIVERQYTMQELVEALDEGRLIEAFAAGTAYFISPVKLIHMRGRDLEIPTTEGQFGPWAKTIKQWLVDIMFGTVSHPWGVVIDETSATKHKRI